MNRSGGQSSDWLDNNNLLLYLLPHVDAAERRHVTVLVLSKHFAHGAGGRLTGQAVDVDLLLFVFITH